MTVFILDSAPICIESSIEDLLPYRKYFTLPPSEEVKQKWHQVTPWIYESEEDNWAIKRNLYAEMQFSLFKCMHPKCIFSTNDGSKFRIHIQSHEALISALDRENELASVVRDIQTRCRECPYCPLNETSEIVDHIENDHKQSILQCGNCFYRSIELENIVLHTEKYHPSTPDESKRRILLCDDGQRCITDKTMQLVLEHLDKSKKLLNCCQCK